MISRAWASKRLRAVVAASGPSIRPKTKANRTELVRLLKELIRAHGENPEQTLAREALSDGATNRVGPDDYESHHLQALANTLKDLMRQDLVREADGSKAPILA